MNKYLMIILLLSFPSLAKPDCDKERQKLKKVQQQLRHGYTVKQGEKLKRKEKELRKKWWLCKRGLSAKNK